MTATAKPEQFRLGFLTTLEVPEQGFVGGLLVTTRHGRPLEFQCTSPVKPNRTVEILYGPSLGPFLLGELIGKTLIEKVGVKPHLVLTEQEEVLELRNHVGTPIACVDSLESPAEEADPNAETPKLRLGRQFIRFHPPHLDEDQQVVTAHMKEITREADLREPFQRVREALLETVRSGALR
ncbi:MAG: hypothetical protein KDA36_06450 [Planctomycetaceae bacterium]|nr:hypothetical protein [Planctomycetaceae bacterium]